MDRLVAPISVLIKYYWLIANIVPNKYILVLWDVSCLGWFSYYYLGLLLGNFIIKKQYNIKKLLILYCISIILQMIEGYIWLSLGESNCGTQIKFSSFLTSSIFLLIAYWYINNANISGNNKLLIMIGNYSFGIYLSHIMVLKILRQIFILVINSICFKFSNCLCC